MWWKGDGMIEVLLFEESDADRCGNRYVENVGDMKDCWEDLEKENEIWWVFDVKMNSLHL